MKFKIKKETIKPLVDKAFSASGKTLGSIYSETLLLWVDKGELVIIGTNGVSQVEVRTTDLDMETRGAACVNARGLYDTVNKAQDGSFSFSLDTESGQLLVKIKRSTMKLDTLNPDDFPDMKFSDPTASIVIDQSELFEGIRSASYAMADKKDFRTHLHGMLFDLNQDGMKLVATSGHRLSVRNIHTLPELYDEVIVPKPTIDQIQKVVRKSTGDSCTVQFNKRMIQVLSDDFLVISKVFNEKFPNYRAGIPQSSLLNLTINTEELKGIVDRASSFRSSRLREVSLSIKKDGITFTAADTGRGKSTETYETDTGVEFSTNFNASYLLDAISAVESEEVEFRINGVDAPSALIDKENIHIIMPVLI